MTNLVPMAGEGKRFKDAGYTTPKPLITVSEKPMIIQAIKGMPPSDKWIFVCRKEHIENYKVDKILKKKIPNAQIITIDKTTQGQTATCLLAKDLIDKKESLYIGTCDATKVWDINKWNSLIGDKKIDCIIWTFTKQFNLSINPKAWGWVDVDENNLVKKISVKVPISDTPYNNQAIIGAFWFRTGQLFVDIAEELIKRNIRVNNEFYVDSIPNLILEHGKRVSTFVVNQYIGWGTPADLQEYEYWENVFLKDNIKSEDKKSQLYVFWKKYFKGR